MRKLILIKHAKPRVEPSVPSDRWDLSDEGRAACAPLADHVAPHAPAVIVSSDEPKAIETGKLLAARLSLPFETAPDLHEHDRTNVPHLRSAEFISMVELFFRRPGELVLGRETADEAERRFTAAVDAALAKHATGNVAIVTHGTVLALFVARMTKQKPFEWWRRLGLPSMVVTELPGYAVEETVERV